MSKKVLVMGGNGFIGQNIVRYFAEAKYEVEIYDLYVKDNGFKNYTGNVLTDDNLDEIISKFDTIVYLITSVSPKKSMEFPIESYTQEIPMLIKVLDSCLKSKCKRVLFSSSGGTVYGEAIKDKLEEDTTVEQPINHYAVCKLTCEKILMLYNKLYGMENIILRVSNPYGIGQKPSSGVGVITTFADKIIKGEVINLYGNGDVVRDFIDVNKVAEAFYKASEWDFDPSIQPVFNVGSGYPLSINDIIKIISEALEINPSINYLESRSFDVKRNVLDMKKTNKYLKMSEQENEIESIKNYVKEMKNQYYNKN